MNLENKVVLVTGASSGIGAAIAKEFVKEGAKVAMVGRNENKLKAVAAECEKLGGKPLVIIADISKDPEAKRVIDTTMGQFGQLDVLVNNAGIGKGMGMEVTDVNAMQVFDEVMNINFRAVVYLTHLATPHLLKSKGNIINISSIGSLMPAGILFAYSSSKAALDHFSRCIAAQLAPKGVRCNTVNPGPVKSDILENSGFNEAHQQAVWNEFKKSTALNRISDASEIADIVVFLASDKAKAITGSSYIVDNGTLLRGVS